MKIQYSPIGVAFFNWLKAREERKKAKIEKKLHGLAERIAEANALCNDVNENIRLNHRGS